MRRILSVLAVAALMVAMMALSAGLAAADTPSGLVDQSAFSGLGGSANPPPGLGNSNVGSACNGIVPAMQQTDTNTGQNQPPSFIDFSLAHLSSPNNC